jgi:hypothetical protein
MIAKIGDAGYRSPYFSHAKRALCHLSYTPYIRLTNINEYMKNIREEYQIDFWIASFAAERSIDGSVVECSPATRAARVRFPVDAVYLVNVSIWNV